MELPAKDNSSQKLLMIQVMRGLAAILVALTHAIALTDRTQGKATLFDWYYLRSFGAIGVDLFFIISGFVLFYSARNLHGFPAGILFMIKRYIRIAPLYFLLTGVIIASRQFIATESSPVTPLGLFNTISMIPWLDTVSYSDPPLGVVSWTLSMEFTFYAMIFVIICIGRASQPWVGIVTIGTLVVVGQFFNISDKPFLVHWWTNPIYLEFLLGISAYWIWSVGGIDSMALTWRFIGLIAVGILISEIFTGFEKVSNHGLVLNHNLGLKRSLIWGLPMFFVFMMLMTWNNRIGTRSKIAQLFLLIGNASYSIYLTHMLTYSVLVRMVDRLPFKMPNAVVVVGVIIAILVGIVTYRLIEQPLTSGLAKLLPPQKNSSS